MTTIRVTDARAQFPNLISTAQTEAVFLERRGKIEAVLVSPEQYERMITALEDEEDIAAFDAALAEEGDNIPWEQVQADLGWS
ncbi:MAG: type II toxin-antitoxin system Phd/YefM family antitoxin [Pseudolysinimonas sp.]